MPTVDGAHVRLLAVDADLARGLREDDRMEAIGQIVVPVLRFAPGPVEIEVEPGPRRPFAYLVLAGALLGQTTLAGAQALHVVGPGDVVHPDAARHLQAATDARVAVLDQSLQLPLATWPGLQVALIERMARQLDRLAMQQAIAQLPHVEQRIVALFRFLAERWGTVTPEGIAPAVKPLISAQCLRVSASDGHMAAASVSFAKKPSMEEMIARWREFEPLPQRLGLPSAPKPFLQYCKEPDRPQTRLDRDFGAGMGISIGRLRPDPLLDYRFVALSHNTLRGAAGGGVLTAELLCHEGYIVRK